MESLPNPNLNPNTEEEEEEEARNWLDLPKDIIAMILLKLGPVEILNNAQRVCSLWRKICKDPLMWRVIDMHNVTVRRVEEMCRHAIDLSCGGLLDISIEYFGTDNLLRYISQSSNQVRRLRLVCCSRVSDRGFLEAVSKLPLLEHLEIYLIYFATETLEAVGRCCPLLKSFKFNYDCCYTRSPDHDKDAFAIAENMCNLRHLQIFGNELTNKGLLAILDGCPYLESLDLRQCLYLNLKGQLESICAERIKNLRLPDDPVDDYEFYFDICAFADGGSHQDDAEYMDYVDYVLNYADDHFEFEDLAVATA